MLIYQKLIVFFYNEFLKYLLYISNASNFKIISFITPTNFSFRLSVSSNFLISDCIFLILFLLFVLNIPVTCIFKSVTGISCPACGMTRAFISILHLNFLNAFLFYGRGLRHEA